MTTPYWMVFPKRHAHEYDFGTPRQQAAIQRLWRRGARRGAWRRIREWATGRSGPERSGRSQGQYERRRP